jgi:prepilin-type N-terminal cleavage/methylation domain-containing protein|tara:strand:+ start:25142 stop:25828 length:687 start_codon:yes stop_codon:yes gene_type:complete
MAWKVKTISATGKSVSRFQAEQARGMTLVELVIAIAVLSVLTGIAVPAIDSAQRARVAREPVNQLHSMAREVRLRAIAERRPYQILFDSEGFKASRFYNPYGGQEEFEDLQTKLDQLEQRDTIIEASQARGIDLSTGEALPDLNRERVEEGIRFLKEYPLDDGVDYKLRFWDDTQWIDMNGGEFRRWVFQPSGMCEPLKIQVESENAFFELEFHPLTADVKTERSWVE